MDKKLINEEIQNMKYLFNYKPGRVISEQEKKTKLKFKQHKNQLEFFTRQKQKKILNLI